MLERTISIFQPLPTSGFAEKVYKGTAEGHCENFKQTHFNKVCVCVSVRTCVCACSQNSEEDLKA